MANKTIDDALKAIRDTLATAEQRIQTEVKRMDDTLAATSVGKIQPVKRITTPALNRVDSYDTGTFYRNWKTAVANATKVLVDTRADVEVQHAANLAALEANKQVHDQVVMLMTHIGIASSTTSYGYATPKARKMVSTTKTAGYLNDLREQVSRDDGYFEVKRRLDEFEARIETYKTESLRKEAAEEAAKTKDRAKRDQLIRLAKLAEKYAVAESDEADEVLRAILSKDKYLMLSHAMACTRYDWNDGPGAVGNALGRFEVVTEEDSAIMGCIEPLVSEWDGDGRVFRDCEYSYSTLRVKVADELLSDYDELLSLNEYFSMA